MEIQTSQTLSIPDKQIFVEEFKVYHDEDGMHVACKSKMFASLFKRTSLAQSPSPPNFTLPFHVTPEMKIWRPGESMIDIFSGHFNRSLWDRGSHIPTNVTFLLLDGLENGIDVTMIHPTSTADSLDFYYGCLQSLQNIYTDWLRPFSVTATLSKWEEKDGD